MYIYVSKEKVKLTTVVEGDHKAPFSIATTPFPGLLHCTLDAYFILQSPKQGSILSSTIFKVFESMTRPGIESMSPGSLANTLPTRSTGVNYHNLLIALKNYGDFYLHKLFR